MLGWLWDGIGNDWDFVRFGGIVGPWGALVGAGDSLSAFGASGVVLGHWRFVICCFGEFYRDLHSGPHFSGSGSRVFSVDRPRIVKNILY